MYLEKVILLLVSGSLNSCVCLAFSNACNRNTPEEEEVSSTPNSGDRSCHPELVDTKLSPLYRGSRVPIEKRPMGRGWGR